MSPSRSARPAREFVRRTRPRRSEAGGVSAGAKRFWDGSSTQRKLTGCADGCSTMAAAEFGDHGGACQASIPHGLVIPSSGLGIVRAQARRDSHLMFEELRAELRTRRATSQSFDAVIRYALAIAIERRWVEPLDGQAEYSQRYKSLLWTLSAAEVAARA